MLSYTCNGQVTLSKPKLYVIGLIGTIADYAVIKPFSSKHLCKHLKWLKLFSALTWLVLTSWMNWWN